MAVKYQEVLGSLCLDQFGFYGYFSLRDLGYFCLNDEIQLRSLETKIYIKKQTDNDKNFKNSLKSPYYMAVKCQEVFGPL